MHSGLNFFDYVIMLSGFVLCLKRIADMERYHALRVVVLTSILGIVVLILVQAFAMTYFYYIPPPCEDDGHFCLTEMSSF
jgi:hypothetical protein